jgi:hypothetical protein
LHLAAVSLTATATAASAPPTSVSCSSTVQFTVLTPRVIRAEHSPSGVFVSKPTISFVFRNRVRPSPFFDPAHTAEALLVILLQSPDLGMHSGSAFPSHFCLCLPSQLSLKSLGVLVQTVSPPNNHAPPNSGWRHHSCAALHRVELN